VIHYLVGHDTPASRNFGLVPEAYYGAVVRWPLVRGVELGTVVDCDYGEN